MKAHIVTLPGDYIGPEIVAQAVKVLNAVAEKYGHTFCFDERRLGGASIDAFGVPLTDETLAACNAADAVLMGSVGGPKWDAVEPARRPEKGLLALRKGMQVFANLRPCTIHPQLSGACPLRPDIIAKPIDIMILRELTGDIYFGKRWRSEDRAAATDEMAYSVPEVERLARIGFEMAKKRRGRLCSVDKANVLECSRLWRETVERLSREYPEVEVSFMYVDNAAMQLILNPAQFDVMITGNLFGDILSDESAAIAGSLGMMPSASLGSTTRGLYEPIHGSAPDIAGRDIANPLGTILSGALLLRHSLGLEQEAAAIERAVSQVLDEGYRTGDIFAAGCTKVGCTQMGDLVAERVQCGLSPLPPPPKSAKTSNFCSRGRFYAISDSLIKRLSSSIQIFQKSKNKAFSEYGALPHRPTKGLSDRPLETFGQKFFVLLLKYRFCSLTASFCSFILIRS